MRRRSSIAIPSNRRPSAAFLLAVLLGFAASLFLISQNLQPCDDAYITFRHARNLATHGRPAWNLEGAPVFGSSSPLYVFVLGGMAYLFGPDRIESLALHLDAWALFAIVLLSYAIARDLTGRALPALLTAGLVGFNCVNVFVLSLGFEAGPFTALLLGSLYAVRRRHDLTAAVLASATPLVRPEGVVAALLVCGYLLLARRASIRLVPAFFALPLLWVAFATPYYGSPVPQSIWAKKRAPAVYKPYEGEEVDLTRRFAAIPALAAGMWAREAQGILFSSSLARVRANPVRSAIGWAALLAFSVLLGSSVARRDGRLVYLLYPPAFVLLYAWIGRTEVWYFPSFVTSSLIVLFAACSRAISAVTRGVGPRGRGLETLATIAVFVPFVLANGYAWNRGTHADPLKGALYPEDPRGRMWQRWERERFEGYRRAARLLNARSVQPGAAVTSEVGVFGFFYEGPVIDASGLCTPGSLAFYPPPASDVYGPDGSYRSAANTIIPTALVRAYEPEHLVSSATYIPHLLAPGADFLREYSLVARSGEAWGQPILVFSRSPSPEPARGDSSP